MNTTEFGSCTNFVQDLWKANLLNHSQLRSMNDYIGRHVDATPVELADYLVGQEVLTRYQADQVLDGRAEALTVWTYVLLDRVGEGSTGAVYKAASRTDKQLYAVKLMPRRNVVGVPRASRELKAFTEFRHPAVVPILHLGTAGDRHYLVWPFAEGAETLAARVRRRGRLPWPEVVRLAEQVAEGLHACHAHGLFHGLLKASDLLIDDQEEVQILDFGLGLLLTTTRTDSLLDTATCANHLANSLATSSPESLLDTACRNPQGDQYSLGCVLYFALTGQYPFARGNEVQQILAHQTQEATPVRQLAPETPPWLEAVVVRLMQKKPEGRFADLKEMVAAFPGHGRAAGPVETRPVLRAETRPVAPPARPEPAAAPARAGIWPTVVVAATGLAVLAGALLWWGR